MMQFFLTFLSEIYFSQKHIYTILYTKTYQSAHQGQSFGHAKQNSTSISEKYSYLSDSALTESRFLSVPSSCSQSELCWGSSAASDIKAFLASVAFSPALAGVLFSYAYTVNWGFVSLMYCYQNRLLILLWCCYLMQRSLQYVGSPVNNQRPLV